MVRLGNRLKALAFGSWRQEFHFRSRAEWLELFARHGLDAGVQKADEGTPFANLLFRLTVTPSSSASTSPSLTSSLIGCPLGETVPPNQRPQEIVRSPGTGCEQYRTSDQRTVVPVADGCSIANARS